MKTFSAAELAFFFRQLGLLTASGIPLLQAWKLLSLDFSRQKQRRLAQVCLQVERGRSLSQALAVCPLFPALACRVLQAGENTGNLEGMCQVLSSYYAQQDKERRQLRQALAYPAFLFVCLILMVCGAVFFILPIFTDMMQQLQVPLPVATQRLVNVVNWLRRYGLFLLLLLAISGVAGYYSWRYERWRWQWERLLWQVPGISKLVFLWSWQRFSRILSVQLKGGIPLLKAWEDALPIVPSLIMRRRLQGAKLFLSWGRSLSQAVHLSRLGTPYIETMLQVGEMTGTYDQSLEAVAVYYGSQLQTWSFRLRRCLGPAMLLLAGCVLGTLILCLLLPLLDMASGMAAV